MPDLPPPPDGYEGWIEFVLECTTMPPSATHSARSELSALRAERDRYRKALEAIKRHHETVCVGNPTMSTTYTIAANALGGTP